jgi:thiamine transporter
MKHLKLRALCEGAILVALATVLSYLKLFELPQGGSVCLGMLPILFYCCRWGLADGLLASFAYGLLQLIFDGAYAWGWTSMLLDYIVAFTVLGSAGLFARKKGGIFIGSVVGCALRFVVHFISGVTIYRIYEPTELFNTTLTNPYLYSAIYNGSYVFLDLVACLVIFSIVYKPLKKYFMGWDLGLE